MAYKEERSNLSSDICQWLSAPSVNNQSQNAPAVIPRVLLVCLPGNRLGNQHGNHIQQPNLWMVYFLLSSLTVSYQVLLRIHIYFKKSAFNNQARHEVLYRVTEGINAE